VSRYQAATVAHTAEETCSRGAVVVLLSLPEPPLREQLHAGLCRNPSRSQRTGCAPA